MQSISSNFYSHYLLKDSLLYFRFRVNYIVNDGQDITNFFIFSKPVEYFFNVSAHHLVYDKNFTNPFVVQPQMLEKLNKTRIFQLQFRAYKSALNKYEIYICNIFNDISSKPSIDLTSPTEAGHSICPSTIKIKGFTFVTPPTPIFETPFIITKHHIVSLSPS
jgi:replication factor A1